MRIAKKRAQDRFCHRQQGLQHTPTGLAVPCHHGRIVAGFAPQNTPRENRLRSNQVVAAVNVECILQDAIGFDFLVSHAGSPENAAANAARLFIQQGGSNQISRIGQRPSAH